MFDANSPGIPEQPGALIQKLRKIAEQLQQSQKKSAFNPSPTMQQAAMQQAAGGGGMPGGGSQPPGGGGMDPLMAMLMGGGGGGGMPPMGGGGGGGGMPPMGGGPSPGGDPLMSLLMGGGMPPTGGPSPGGSPGGDLSSIFGTPPEDTGGKGEKTDKESIREIVREELQQALAAQSGPNQEDNIAASGAKTKSRAASFKIDQNVFYSLLDVLKTMSDQIISITRINRQIAEALGLQVPSGDLLKSDETLENMASSLKNLQEEIKGEKTPEKMQQNQAEMQPKQQAQQEQQTQQKTQPTPPGVQKPAQDSRLNTGAIQVPRMHSKVEDQGHIAEKLKLFVKRWSQE